MEQKKNQPEKKFRAGAVSATVWNNPGTGSNGQSIAYKTVNLDRTYKDKDGEWQRANSLRLNDIPKAIVALETAYEFLVVKPKNNEVVVEEMVVE